MVLSGDQVQYLKATWPELSSGDGGRMLGLDMFVKYFDENPDMMHVFGYTGNVHRLRHNERLQNHGAKILAQIGQAVAEIDNPQKMAATLKALGHRHKGFGPIEAKHFPGLGDALLEAMEEKVPQVDRQIWSAGYAEISHHLIEGLQS